MGHEVLEGELTVREVYDTKSLPKHKGIQKGKKFSIILDIS